LPENKPALLESVAADIKRVAARALNTALKFSVYFNLILMDGMANTPRKN